MAHFHGPFGFPEKFRVTRSRPTIRMAFSGSPYPNPRKPKRSRSRSNKPKGFPFPD